MDEAESQWAAVQELEEALRALCTEHQAIWAGVLDKDGTMRVRAWTPLPHPTADTLPELIVVDVRIDTDFVVESPSSAAEKVIGTLMAKRAELTSVPA